ncbi:MAG: discoidin domain-containing protein, partial [Oscillospiraceae bacterium]
SNKPIVSGGVDISTGWEVHDANNNIYKKTGVNWDFRQLYTSGDRAIRARSINMTNPLTAGPYHRGGNGDANYPMKISLNRDGMAANNGVAEMIWVASWSQFRARVEKYDVLGDGSVTFKAPEKDFAWDHHVQGNTPYFFENAYEYIDAESEWFLDSATDTLYYKPRKGEVMNTAKISAPKLETLVNIEGVSKENKVKNIKIEGIQFNHTNWLKPSEVGYCSVQGGFRYQTVSGGTTKQLRGPARYEAPTSMLQLKYTSNITLDKNDFSFSGSWGVMGYNGTDHTMISNNKFYKNAGGGVTLGMAGNEWDDMDENEKIRTYTDMDGQSIYDSIVNNVVDTVACDYKDMIGIGALLPQNITIAHNEVANLPYTGINLGWNWQDTDHGMTGNKVYQNYIHDVCLLLQDGGGIYTLGRMDGDSIFYYNYIKNIEMGQWAPWDNLMGIYFDNGSCYKKAQANVFDNTVYAFQASNPPNHDNIFEGNYYNCPKGTSSIGSISAILNRPFTSAEVPAEAQRIMDAAGPGKPDLPPPGTSYNLSIGKTATASSVDTVGGFLPGNAVDGNSDTRWAQEDIPVKPDESKDPTWLKVDLGEKHSISEIIIAFEFGNRCKYKLEYSDDDINWKTYVDKLNVDPSASETVYASKPNVSARYVKLTMTSSGWGSGVRELSVYTNEVMTPNSTLSISEAEFELNPSWQKPITLKTILNGSKLSEIKNGSYTLVSGKDYIKHWDNITLNTNYLKTLTGTATLDFVFDKGPSRPLKITVIADDGAENVALNKSITASSVSLAPELMIDGDKKTRWAQKEGTANVPAIINIDLGNLYDISKISTMFELNSGYNYKIEYSENNQLWQEYVDKMGEKTAVQTIVDAKAVTARYIRITANHSQLGASIWEFEVKGVLNKDKPVEKLVNVLANKKAVSSSTDPDHPISYINDNDTATRWAQTLGTKNVPTTIVFDLERECDIEGTSIMFEMANGYDYKIETSKDNQNWELYVDKTSGLTTSQIVNDTKNAKARYIKLIVNHKDWGASIYEFSAFEREKPSPTPTKNPKPTPRPSTTATASPTPPATTIPK